jgi:hypothetical protein
MGALACGALQKRKKKKKKKKVTKKFELQTNNISESKTVRRFSLALTVRRITADYSCTNMAPKKKLIETLKQEFL